MRLQPRTQDLAFLAALLPLAPLDSVSDLSLSDLLTAWAFDMSLTECLLLAPLVLLAATPGSSGKVKYLLCLLMPSPLLLTGHLTPLINPAPLHA